jgi:pyridoxamine 5'-phosphate oxidase family protein
MTFRPHEVDFMRSTPLGRLATIQPNGTLQNSPVAFTYNEDLGTIDIFGYRMSNSQKYRNLGTNPTVAFVVDDIASYDPWRVRCLEIRGTAEQVQLSEAVTSPNGDQLDTAIVRITPRRIIGFGIDDTDTDPHLVKADARNV